MALNKIGKSYDYRAICDVCGFKKWSYELRERWDGKMVCHEDWEPRNILDFYRTRNDAHRLPFTRPDAQEVTTETSLSGYALATNNSANAQTTNMIPYLVTAYPVTIEAMVMVTTPASGQLFDICRYHFGHLIFRYEVLGSLSLYFNNAGNFRQINSGVVGFPLLNTWTRITAVMTSDTTGAFYLTYQNSSGTIVQVIDTTPTNGSLGPYAGSNPEFFFIGSTTYVGPENSFPYIDDVRIWNQVRTAAQIKTYWNTVVPPTTSGLISNYRFDEGFKGNQPSPTTVDSVAPGVRDMTLYGSSYFPHMMQYSNSGI